MPDHSLHGDAPTPVSHDVPDSFVGASARELELQVLAVMIRRELRPGQVLEYSALGEALGRPDGIDDPLLRAAVERLDRAGQVSAHARTLEITAAGIARYHTAGAPTFDFVLSPDAYAAAQLGLSSLKVGVFRALAAAPPRGLSNAELARALGLDVGQPGHEWRLCRSILGILAGEGRAIQHPQTETWHAVRSLSDRTPD